MWNRKIAIIVAVLLTLLTVAVFADFKAALVLNQRRGDLAVIDQMAGGLEQAQKDLGIEIKIVESRDATEYEDNIRAMVDWGANIIFTSFEPLVKPALASANQNPNVKYALIYASIDNPPANVLPITYNDIEASYLSGVVAAMKTKSGKVAFTTGADIPSQRTAYDGFAKGVHSIKPDAKTFFAVIGSFEDPAKGKEVGLSMISQGVDVFCGWAAKSDFGIIEAAKENGKWVCGLSGVLDLRSRYPASSSTRRGYSSESRSMRRRRRCTSTRSGMAAKPSTRR